MLKIVHDTLPQSRLCYFVFRVAFCETLERIGLWRQFGGEADAIFGFLTEVPFLREVPPQVQLELLADTWRKHCRAESVAADLVDESVIYAACETAARLVESDRSAVERYLRGGPVDVRLTVSEVLAAQIRALHLSLPNEGDFLLIGQFLDMPPDEADQLKRQFRIRPESLEVMFDVLARWRLSPEFLHKLDGLVTRRELAAVAKILGPTDQQGASSGGI